MVRDSRTLARAVALLLLCLSGSAAASPPADAPHYASVRRSEAYLREGPSYAHRILWIYRRRNYPVRIVGSYDAWRHVKDVDGATGWMHHTQLSEKRSVVFIGFTKSALRADGGPNGKIVAYAARGVVAWLKACELSVCEVDAAGTEGWVDKRNIWGVDAGEVFQ